GDLPSQAQFAREGNLLTHAIHRLAFEDIFIAEVQPRIGKGLDLRDDRLGRLPALLSRLDVRVVFRGLLDKRGQGQELFLVFFGGERPDSTDPEHQYPKDKATATYHGCLT